MNINKITTLDTIALLENATELFQLDRYKSQKFVQDYLAIGLSRAGFYGTISASGEITPLNILKTEFNSDQDVAILIEGIQLLGKAPSNAGSGNVTYLGYGLLEVDGAVIYDGRGASSGADLSYDNGTSGLTAVTIQGAIDELAADGAGHEETANKGVANGYASLNGSGKVPSSELPSYVDDVIEVANFAALPVTGETGKIYITLDDDKIYRWTGSMYMEISSGTTDLSEGASTTTTVDVNSSNGTNATLQPASTLRAGVQTKANFDQVETNRVSFEYEVAFVEIEQILQLFRKDSSITGIDLANVDTLSYDINETGSFTTLTLPGDLPLAVSAGDTITWQIAYSAGKDKASLNIVGTEV